MRSLVFVHGTGTREPGYSIALRRVTEELHSRRPGLKVLPCMWGEPFGYELNANGISIPGFADSRGPGVLGEGQLASAEDDEVALWALLYRDPLGELRLLRETQAQAAGAAQSPAGLALDNQIRGLSVAGLGMDSAAALNAAGLAGVFDTALAEVRSDPAYADALRGMPTQSLPVYRAAALRSIVAMAVVRSQLAGDYPPLLLDASLRDALLETLGREFTQSGPGTLGLFDPIKARASAGLASILTGRIQRRRGPLMEHVLGFIGDILVYQGRGEEIRGLIRDTVRQAEPPVVLLAHSLGGIACVDLLIEQDLSAQVQLLVTVGSQSPLFYEMGALPSLKYDRAATLPAHFPAWLNIYDLNDFLSFVGEGLFPGRVKDMPVDNRQPFPYSHSAYWANAVAWDAIAEAVRDPHSV